MRRSFTPKVVSANALLSGHVVYLSEDDRWVRDHRAAELIEDEAHAAIRLIDAQARHSEIVGAYLADARRGPDGPEPVHLREALRTTGPSASTRHRALPPQFASRAIR